MKLGMTIIKLIGALLVFSFSMCMCLLSCVSKLPAPAAKPKKSLTSKEKKEKGSWWDYDRNTLDNDIEQFGHVDGIPGGK